MPNEWKKHELLNCLLFNNKNHLIITVNVSEDPLTGTVNWIVKE